MGYVVRIVQWSHHATGFGMCIEIRPIQIFKAATGTVSVVTNWARRDAMELYLCWAKTNSTNIFAVGTYSPGLIYMYKLRLSVEEDVAVVP